MSTVLSPVETTSSRLRVAPGATTLPSRFVGVRRKHSKRLSPVQGITGPSRLYDDDTVASDPYCSEPSSILVFLPGLTRPVEAFLERDGQNALLVDRKTGIFGSGRTTRAAAEDLEAALKDHFDVLRRSPNLSMALVRQLEYLVSYFTSDE
jgi:hypothetical protein